MSTNKKIIYVIGYSTIHVYDIDKNEIIAVHDYKFIDEDLHFQTTHNMSIHKENIYLNSSKNICVISTIDFTIVHKFDPILNMPRGYFPKYEDEMRRLLTMSLKIYDDKLYILMDDETLYIMIFNLNGEFIRELYCNELKNKDLHCESIDIYNNRIYVACRVRKFPYLHADFRDTIYVIE